jgi:peptidoglycan/xylan/chitin deacetylase (PgdA/CDA1 family)
MKIASFTFDDGLIKSAYQIVKTNIPTTFYIVTGWTLGNIVIEDSFNKNIDHGSIDEWISLRVDMGCHSHNHKKNFNEKESYDVFKKHFKKPYNFATPYGIKKNLNFFDSCKIGFFNKYNDLTKDSIKCLSSINPQYDIKNDDEKLEDIIKNCPDFKWIIFTFHGIEEGWMPISLDYFKILNDKLKKNKFEIKTISEVIREIDNGRYNIQ